MQRVNAEKERKELKRLKRALTAPKPVFYLGLVMVVLTVIYVVDEITSNMNSSMQPEERAERAQKDKKENTSEQGGVFNAIKFISFGHFLGQAWKKESVSGAWRRCDIGTCAVCGCVPHGLGPDSCGWRVRLFHRRLVVDE